MELAIHGKQMDVGDALRTHVTTRLEDINSKYFNRAIDVNVTFSPESHSFIKSHVSLRVGRDIMVQASAIEPNAYAAFDSAAEKVAKQLGRYKRRLRDHHERLEQSPEAELTKARDYILAIKEIDGLSDKDVEDEDVPHGNDPLIIAEAAMHIQKMSVSDAVMRMDLSGQSALLFRNPKNNRLNMVYRRTDGNIGWVEPAEEAATAAAAE
ncbi:MAG TPA: ribosome-associated translation inhibitor RaiA [Rhodospirillaceae bacterium]|nr:ribosome-associated translation inhibitor RaiA [Rhodospirillaceae bacterium]